MFILGGCPFCGGDNHDYVGDPLAREGHKVHVQCRDCCACGPTANSITEAGQKWNARSINRCAICLQPHCSPHIHAPEAPTASPPPLAYFFSSLADKTAFTSPLFPGAKLRKVAVDRAELVEGEIVDIGNGRGYRVGVFCVAPGTPVTPDR